MIIHKVSMSHHIKEGVIFMKVRKKAIFILLMISILGLAGCATKAEEATSAKQDKSSNAANQSTPSYQYDKTSNDFLWTPDESGNYVTNSGISLTREELENLRMYLWDETIASMPQDVYDNHFKGYKGHGEFSIKENLITDNFIYSKEETSSLERDDIVARAKEELSK